MPLPTISIISPSYNQALFLPHCLGSVRAQSHPALEHIVIDPGSTDGSRDIARAAPSVTLIAEPDNGQCDAINKGFAKARGDILAWLNSDDQFNDPDVLKVVAERFAAADAPDVVYGRATFIDERGEKLRDAFINTKPETLRASLPYQVGIIQPAVFMHRRVFENLGGLDESFEYALDYEYWVRIVTSGLRWAFVDRTLANHRWWADMKTASKRDLSLREHCRVTLKHFKYAHWAWISRLSDCIVGGVDGIVNNDASQISPMDRRRKIAELHLEYNTDYATRTFLRSNLHDPNVAQTVADMVNHGVSIGAAHRMADDIELAPNASDPTKGAPSWQVLSGTEKRTRASVKGYQFGPNHAAFYETAYFDDTLRRSALALHDLAKNRTEDVCVIVGNGPSLARTSRKALVGCDIVISNFAYYDQELLNRARYLTIVNELVLRQAAADLPTLRSVVKVFPIWFSQFIGEDPSNIFLNATLKPEFSSAAHETISWRSTVSFFNLQLAATLGYKKIVLVGFDHEYKQPKEMKEGDVIDQQADDENHFLKNYFKGKKWQAADTNNMEKVYLIAKESCDRLGIDVVNCTVGGKLEVFRRGQLDMELGP